VNPKDRIIGSKLVVLGSAAVMTVYSAGYFRTRSAAQRFAGEDAQRRPAVATASVGTAPNAKALPIANASASAQPASAREPGARSIETSKPSTAPLAAQSTPSAPKKATATTATTVVAAIATPPVAPPTDTSRTTAASSAADSSAEQKEMARAQYTDGTFTGWGTSRHGDIQASVEIRNGRIASASISECLTRYSCSWISALPGQVVSRQSAEVDYVSGATQSSNAFYYAVVEALHKAK
jgi:uncharacterized protein with FMN-binding domain